MLFLCGNYSSLWAFGQNKVQYHQFLWSFYRTEHFDIYFPQGADRLATFAGKNVEDMYRSVSKTVGHQLATRVPIILHNSHAEFEQTNVIRLPLHEGIGGFTEIFKNRIVLPFEGSYTEFHHVLQHEMTHAVVFDMLFGEAAGASVGRQVAYQFPLWVSEGLAEYASLGWDLSSEFFMLDATTFGYVAPPTVDFGGFLAYKGGQLFFHFVESTYGKGTVTKLIQALREMRDLPDAFKKVTNTSLEEAGELWLRELRYIYWPELGQRKYGKSVARQLTDHGRDLSFFNLQPSISPNGKEIAFFSDRESWEGIFILNIKTEKITRSVIQGGKGGKHESFHAFKSGIAWSPDSKRLAIVSKSGGLDVIHLIDVKTGKVRKEIRPNVQAILSPSWSRDGGYIAFSGMNENLTDIYVWDIAHENLKRLTHDLAHDDKPVFSPSGNWIAFETDRPDALMKSYTADPLDDYSHLLPASDIYKINIAGDTLIKVSGGTYDEKMPSYGANDSSLVFISNRSGIDNIYLHRDSASIGIDKPISNLLSGCFTPSWSWDGKLLAFSLFEQGGWDIFLMKNPLEKVLPQELPKTLFIKTQEDSTLRFFRLVNWANLSSMNVDSLKADSLYQDSMKVVDAKIKADSLTRSKIASKDSLAKVTKDSANINTDSSSKAANHEKEKMASKENKTENAKKKSVFALDSNEYIAADGRFIKRKYSPSFSLDMVNAGVAYDNIYGAGGLGYITLSDLMGDQELAFALNLNGSFDNMSLAMAYNYLALKPDFSISGTYEAYLSNNSILYPADSIFIDRQFRIAGGMSYPWSVFDRWELNVHSFFNTRTLSETVDSGSVDNYQPLEVNGVMPELDIVHDNTLWGIVGPVNGERVQAGIIMLPPLTQNKYSYIEATVDGRKYWEFGKKYTLAAKVTAGLSEPLGDYENPHFFPVGGDEFNLFNPRPNVQVLDIPHQQFYYADYPIALRGFEYYDFIGTRMFASSLEFRFPFIQEFTVVWPIPFSLRYITGSVFTDYGGAWSQGNAFSQTGLSMGYGMRMNLGIFVLRYTTAKAILINGFAENNRPWREYWSLGAEF